MLANYIFDEISGVLSHMDVDVIKNASIGIAHYIEDRLSNTRQFEAFAKLYQKMYGWQLPFFEDSDDPLTREQNALRFVVWYCICAEHSLVIINPVVGLVEDVAQIVEEIADEAVSKFNCLPNNDLADYIFSEETLNDPILVKNVLIWIQSRSFLGRWDGNDPKDDDYSFRQIFPNAQKDQLEYCNASVMAFDRQAWPLSLSAKMIYAEMIRIDMDDEDDEYAALVEAIEFKPFGVYKIDGIQGRDLTLIDYQGDKFVVDSYSAEINLKKVVAETTHSTSAYFSYNGEWNLCGLSGWINIDDQGYDEYCTKRKKDYNNMHGHVGQYDDFIKSHGGRRLFFFENVEEYIDWVRTELGLDGKFDTVRERYGNERGLVLFFEDNGQTTISSFGNLIKHPDNPYYDKIEASKNALGFVVHELLASPCLLEYLLVNGFLPDIGINDRRGDEYGRAICRENAEFLARCFRRDIKKQEVFCPRKHISLEEIRKEYEDEVDDFGRLTLGGLVEKIKENKYVVSAANKHWKVMSVNTKSIKLKDEERSNTVVIDMDDLYSAYLVLEPSEYQVAKLVPYVGNKLASPAATVLYSVVGRGKYLSAARRMFQDLKL